MELLFWLVPILLGYLFGRRAEKAHYESILRREEAMQRLPATSGKQPLDTSRPIRHAQLVHGNVVISIDYFKRLLALLRGLIGGPVRSYEPLLDRARREAILRLKESCDDADEIINLRLETSSISQDAKSAIGSVEVFAYGTAIYYASK